MITQRLVEAVRRVFVLDWKGIHGVAHWARVRENGLRLAGLVGANTEVVELFAFLHDSRRMNDSRDPDHGARAAEFARSLRGSIITLSDDDFSLLEQACRDHSKGLVKAAVTVQVCWDADRLDLGRVGIQPSASYLCTEAARNPDLIAWAYTRSLTRPTTWPELP